MSNKNNYIGYFWRGGRKGVKMETSTWSTWQIDQMVFTMFTFSCGMLNRKMLLFFLNHPHMYMLFYMFNIFHNKYFTKSKYIDAK